MVYENVFVLVIRPTLLGIIIIISIVPPMPMPAPIHRQLARSLQVARFHRRYVELL